MIPHHRNPVMCLGHAASELSDAAFGTDLQATAPRVKFILLDIRMFKLAHIPWAGQVIYSQDVVSPKIPPALAGNGLLLPCLNSLAFVSCRNEHHL